MSFNGSTAPTIVSPILAWPSRPSARSSPLSTPSTSGFDDGFYSTAPSSQDTMALAMAGSEGGSRKGKERALDAPEVRVYTMEDGRGRGVSYGPPRKPLTPNQLGRIAQSFGIVVPNLSAPSPIVSPNGRSTSPTSASASTSRHLAPTRPSPHLLAVIPPLSLLAPTSATTHEASQDRIRRWRRGKLLPLQPTMGGMLLCIAREYGLPSTTGLKLYLVNQPNTKGSEASFGSGSDDTTGPMISPQTWSALFSAYAIGNSGMSRSSSPSHTPQKSHGPLGRDIQYPPSPLSMRHEGQPKTFASPTKKHLTKSSSSHSSQLSSSTLPPTPASERSLFPPNPVVGTVEFEIDPEAAGWYEDWRRTGPALRMHKRKTSTMSEGGMRELQLPLKLKDERPRFLRELGRSQSSDFEAESYAPLGDSEGEEETETPFGPPNITFDQDPLDDLFPSASSEYAILRSNRPSTGGRRLSIKDIGTDRVLSASASLDFTESIHGDGPDREVLEVMDMLAAKRDADLLASPIELEKAELSRVMDLMDKRGSGLVMSDELADLEKLMRQLSPREIRLTSPRMLTPRMAAKVAYTNLEPVIGASHLAPRSLPKPASSPLASTEPEPAKAAWPSVPYMPPTDFSSPPLEPWSDLDPYPLLTTRNGTTPPPMTLSKETLTRMQNIEPTKTISTEWKPRRPVRPPSPNLSQTHERNLSYSLGSAHVDQLRSPEVTTPEDRWRLKSRSNSISLKGLKSQMSSKNLNTLWKKDEVRPELPQAKPDKEAMGLFGGAPVAVEGKSSFPGLSKRVDVGEFGESVTPTRSTSINVHANANTNGNGNASMTLPTRLPSSGGFASRLFSFSRKPSQTESTASPKSPKTAHKPQSSFSGSTNNTTRSLSISSPITDSFHHLDSGSPKKDGFGGSGSPGMGEGATSPKSVRRKPVPGPGAGGAVGLGKGMMGGGESFGDMRGFVLEDPPKRRLGGGMGTAV